jgi:pilus assembly protein FimV
MKRTNLVSRGVTLAFIVTVVVGCAAGQAGSPNPGSAGSTGIAGATAGSTGLAGAGSGTGGSGGCVTPPVVQVSWQMMTTPDLSSPKLSCAQVGAKYVDFFLDTAHAHFDCAPGSGMSTDFLPGTYTPRILLSNAQGQPIFNESAPKPVTVPSCGVTNIGNYALVVGTTGAAGSGGSGAAGSSGSAGSGGTTGTGGGSGGSMGTAGTGGGGPCNAMSIFAMHSCAFPGACHDASGTSAGFNMATPGWEKNLVGKVPQGGGAAGFSSACKSSGMPYLMAGSVPAQGLFLKKLQPKPPCGSEMPVLTTYLTPDELACVQTWANSLTKP